MCANCTIRRIFKVTIYGSTELLSALVALEQYGGNEVIAFAVRGSIIEVVLMEKEWTIMTLRDVLLACGNLKNGSVVIITDMNNKNICHDTVSGCFEKNPAYMKMEVDYFKIFFNKNGDKIVCLI